MSHTSARSIAGLLAVAAVFCTGLVRAETATPGSDDWRFEFTPYVFFTGLDGTIGIRGVKGDIDVGFSDLEPYITLANMGVFEADKGRWIFAFEGIYVKLEDSGTRVFDPVGSITISVKQDMHQVIYQGTVGYRMVDDRTKVDVFGAARYTKLSLDVSVADTSLGPILPGGSFSIDGTQRWTDPVIGVRVLHALNEHWALLGLVDVGGFGVNGDIDRTYQGIAGVNWQFSKHFSGKAGYRYLYQNYQNDGFVWDVVMQGPYVALGIQF